MIGGYGCRAALQKWEGRQLLPWLLILYAVSVIATRAVGFIHHVALAEILIPFCVMAIANGAIYPIVVAQALRPFPQATGRARGAAEYASTGLMLPGKSGCVVVDQHAAIHHYWRHAVYGVAGRAGVQNAVAERMSLSR